MILQVAKETAMIPWLARAIAMNAATRKSDCNDTRFNRNKSCLKTSKFISDNVAQARMLRTCNALRQWLQKSSFDKKLDNQPLKFASRSWKRGWSTQSCLFPELEKWQKTDRKIANFPESFGTLPRTPLAAVSETTRPLLGARPHLHGLVRPYNPATG